MKASKSYFLTYRRILDLCKEIDLDVLDHSMSLGEITCLSSIEETNTSSLSYLVSADTLLSHLNEIKGMVLLSSDLINVVDLSDAPFDFIIVSDPKYLFAFIYQSYREYFDEKPSLKVRVENEFSNSKISSGAAIDENVRIGVGVEIESGVRIFAGTVLGDYVRIGANSVLGGIGFGFAVRKGYPPLRIPHFGTLQIGDRVEIGSGTHIDRGTFSATRISDDVKIDNGVHIAHNVFIGRRTLVTAHAEISGSVQIGDDCWIAPNVSIKEKVKIGNYVLVGLGSVVLRDIESNLVVAGTPARIIKSRS